jgi:hypothetical protein
VLIEFINCLIKVTNNSYDTRWKPEINVVKDLVTVSNIIRRYIDIFYEFFFKFCTFFIFYFMFMYSYSYLCSLLQTCFHPANWHSSAAMTEDFPSFFLSCSKCQIVTRKDGARRSLFPNELCCSVYCLCANVHCATATSCQPNCS